MTESEDLRQQLKAALKSRAMLYASLLDELTAEVGAAKAEAIMTRAIHARGAAAGNRFFSSHAPADFEGLRHRFIDFLPDHGRLFDLETLRCDDDGLDLKFHSCPIKEAWQEAGFAPQTMQVLCRIAGSVDVGTFEGAGFAIRNETWQVGGDGCCLLKIRRKAPRPAESAGCDTTVPGDR